MHKNIQKIEVSFLDPILRTFLNLFYLKADEAGMNKTRRLTENRKRSKSRIGMYLKLPNSFSNK